MENKNENKLMPTSPSVRSSRILYTPSTFARCTLLHIQEVGSLQAIHPHTSTRKNLTSFLFFVVLEGEGEVEYEGKRYELRKGDCVFIDCRKAYSHTTPINKDKNRTNQDNSIPESINRASNYTTEENKEEKKCVGLWSLLWCHFYASSLPAIYEKYKERGGSPVFHPDSIASIKTILIDLYKLASSSDHIRDMRINESLATLLTLLMEQSWNPESKKESRKRMELVEVKKYLDDHYTEKITLDDLSEKFFINKYYLTRIFKEAYGATINSYILSLRITKAKQFLRFTEMSIEEIGASVGMEDLNYFSRSFRKVEGVSPTEYRKNW